MSDDTIAFTMDEIVYFSLVFVYMLWRYSVSLDFDFLEHRFLIFIDIVIQAKYYYNKYGEHLVSDMFYLDFATYIY